MPDISVKLNYTNCGKSVFNIADLEVIASYAVG